MARRVQVEKAFGDLEAKKEYLKKFRNTGGGEVIEKNHKWTTEKRDPEQGRDPKTGQFIDNYSIDRDTKYEHRGKNLIPFIFRGLFASLLGFNSEDEVFVGRGKDGKGAAYLDSIKINMGDIIGSGYAQVVATQTFSASDLLSMWGADLTNREYNGPKLEDAFAQRKGNYKSMEGEISKYRLGDRQKLSDNQGHFFDSDEYGGDWEDNEMTTSELNNYYLDKLRRPATMSGDGIEINDVDSIDENDENMTSRYVALSNICGSQEDFNEMCNRISNMSEKFASLFEKYAKDGSDEEIDRIKTYAAEWVVNGAKSRPKTDKNGGKISNAGNIEKAKDALFVGDSENPPIITLPDYPKSSDFYDSDKHKGKIEGYDEDGKPIRYGHKFKNATLKRMSKDGKPVKVRPLSQTGGFEGKKGAHKSNVERSKYLYGKTEPRVWRRKDGTISKKKDVDIGNHFAEEYNRKYGDKNLTASQKNKASYKYYKKIRKAKAKRRLKYKEYPWPEHRKV